MVMITKPMNRVAINVARPCGPAQPSGSKRHQAQGCAPEQALRPPGPSTRRSWVKLCR
jgi:hypothetical protein